MGTKHMVRHVPLAGAMPLLRSLGWILAASLTFAAVPACSSQSGVQRGDDANLTSQLSAESLKTAADYDRFATDGGGFGQAGKSMKFLIDNRDPQNRSIHFINGNFKVDGKTPDFAKFHFRFAQKQLG